MNANVKKLIDTLNAKGKSYSQIQTTLVALDHAESASKAAELLKEAGIEKGKKVAILDAMYDYLKEAPRTEEEFKAWVEANGTENTMRWIKTHDKARQMANEIHAKYAEPEAEAE